MRAAPAVSVHGSGGLPWQLLQTVLPSLAAACLVLWVVQTQQRSGWWAVAAMLLVAGVSWRLSAPRDHDLRFDSGQWWLDECPGTLDLMLDLDVAVLLRWRSASPDTATHTQWLALTAAEIGPDWHALRLALHTQSRAVGT